MSELYICWCVLVGVDYLIRAACPLVNKCLLGSIAFSALLTSVLGGYSKSNPEQNKSCFCERQFSLILSMELSVVKKSGNLIFSRTMPEDGFAE